MGVQLLYRVFSSCIPAHGVGCDSKYWKPGEVGMAAAMSPSQGLVLGNAGLTQGHGLLVTPGEQSGPGCMRMDQCGGAEAAMPKGIWLQGLQGSDEMKRRGTAAQRGIS